ncbi:MAG: hypothetical protein IPH64_14510 [Comamonadaceae bacterium]|jgi:hypothetical protein|uniref:hypothetical protein n=1 Tax=Candidatus Skiveiella danica TaxID=3386177 RepID=UPI001D73B092|nr:hypothetical protein [Comamonadaceae bacterium]MBK9198042.1 hypothetical protein [Betaproteobacteria bacterium]MBK6559736.1 hypothetical protein [Comamonadaceae bacterium]MBK7120097.1 hypothetical protein [Comamonadaceae bacterium]MBK7507888.1 hypothetical protein [Comamonadaceae bacterium]
MQRNILCTPIPVALVSLHRHGLVEGEVGQTFFLAVAECLGHFRRIDSRQANLVLHLRGVQDGYGVAICDTDYPASDSFGIGSEKQGQQQGGEEEMHRASMKLDVSGGNPDLAPSLDRIDSSKHYEPGNLQVVARFINRWKSDDEQENFLRLLKLVKAMPSES